MENEEEQWFPAEDLAAPNVDHAEIPWDPNAPLIFPREPAPNPFPSADNPFLWPDKAHILCSNCHLHGHERLDCPYPGEMCYNCFTPGHIRPNCPQPLRRSRAQRPLCTRCGQNGHQYRQCPDPRKICYICRERGHIARFCPLPIPPENFPWTAAVGQPEPRQPEAQQPEARPEARQPLAEVRRPEARQPLAEVRQPEARRHEARRPLAEVRQPEVRQSEARQPEARRPLAEVRLPEARHPEQRQPERRQPERNGVPEHEEQEGGGDRPGPCTICMVRISQRICVPCGHVCLCKYCARELRSRLMYNCPVCREDVWEFIKMYFV